MGQNLTSLEMRD